MEIQNFTMKQDGFIGILCQTDDDRFPGKALLIVGGGDGRYSITKAAAAYFAGSGLTALALAYWNQSGLPSEVNKPTQSAKNLLFYVPMILVSTSNLRMGVQMNLTPTELVFHIRLMLCVGFLEELIFRGFLFEALRKKSLKTAVIVSGLTFGAGHIINLFNGGDMSLRKVLCQIAFAVLIGFLFVMVYLRSSSLIPCTLSHQTINILSAFANYQAAESCHLMVNLIEMAIILLYLLVIIKAVPVANDTQ